MSDFKYVTATEAGDVEVSPAIVKVLNRTLRLMKKLGFLAGDAHLTVMALAALFQARAELDEKSMESIRKLAVQLTREGNLDD